MAKALKENNKMKKLTALFICCLAITVNSYGQEEAANNHGSYQVNPGDIISVFIWGEEGLSPRSSAITPVY